VVLISDFCYRLFSHPSRERLTVFEFSGAVKLHRAAIVFSIELLFDKGTLDTSNHFVFKILPVEELRICRERTVSIPPQTQPRNHRRPAQAERRQRGPGNHPSNPYVID
jgi:hypothetical protein